jgi:uncharacterized protein YbaR (Trm112 family)
MQEWIIEILRCPQSGGKLTLVPDESISKLMELSRAGKLFTVMGRTVSDFSSQGLVSENGRWLYRIDQEIICLLPEEAIDLKDAVECAV